MFLKNPPQSKILHLDSYISGFDKNMSASREIFIEFQRKKAVFQGIGLYAYETDDDRIF